MRDNNFGKNLAAMRACKGLTLSDLAGLTHINAKTINKYETGLLMPTVSNLIILSDYFCLDTDTFLKREIVLKYEIKPDIRTR